MAKKTYVLDTNVYLTSAGSIDAYGNNDIIIPLKILDEIDKHKKRQDSVGSQAREIIRRLDHFRSGGNLSKGVRMGKGKGILKVCAYNPFCIPDDLDLYLHCRLRVVLFGKSIYQTHPYPNTLLPSSQQYG